MICERKCYVSLSGWSTELLVLILIFSLSLHSSWQGLRLCFLYPGPLGPRVRSWWQSSQLTLDEYVA